MSVTYNTDIDIKTGVKVVTLQVLRQYDRQQIILTVCFCATLMSHTAEQRVQPAAPKQRCSRKKGKAYFKRSMSGFINRYWVIQMRFESEKSFLT